MQPVGNLPKLPSKKQIKETLKEWHRVLKLARKPRKQEFVNVAKITGLGIIVVGLLGFLIKLISYYASMLVK